MKADTPDRPATLPADDDVAVSTIRVPVVRVLPSWRVSAAIVAAGLDGVAYRPWPEAASPRD